MSYEDLLDDQFDNEPESQFVRSNKKTHISSTSQETFKQTQRPKPGKYDRQQQNVDLLNFEIQSDSDQERPIPHQTISSQNTRQKILDNQQPTQQIGFDNMNESQPINQESEAQNQVLQTKSTLTKDEKNIEEQELVDVTLKKIGKYLLIEQIPLSDQGSSQLFVVQDTQQNRILTMRIVPTKNMPNNIVNQFIFEHQNMVGNNEKCDSQVKIVDFIITDQCLFVISELIRFPNLKQLCKQFSHLHSVIVMSFIQKLMHAVDKIRKCYKIEDLGNLKLNNIFYHEVLNIIQISDFASSYQKLKNEYQKLNGNQIQQTSQRDFRSIAQIAFQLFYGKESISLLENYSKFKEFVLDKNIINDHINKEIEEWIENCLFSEDYTEAESIKFVNKYIQKKTILKKEKYNHQIYETLAKYFTQILALQQEHTYMCMKVKTRPPEYVFRDFQFKFSDSFIRLQIDYEIQQKLYKTQKNMKSIYEDTANIISFKNKKLFYDIPIYDTISDLQQYNFEIMSELDDYPYFDLKENEKKEMELQYNLQQYNFEIYERMITKKFCSMRVRDKYTDKKYIIYNFQPYDDIQFKDIIKQISVNVFLKYSEHTVLELNMFEEINEAYDENIDNSVKESTRDVTENYLKNLYMMGVQKVDYEQPKVQTLKEAFIIKKNKFLSFFMILDDYDYSLKDYFFRNQNSPKNVDAQIQNDSIIFCSNKISRVMRKLKKQKICHNNIAPENIIFQKINGDKLKLMIRNFEKCIICKTDNFKNMNLQFSKNMENFKYKAEEISNAFDAKDNDFVNLTCNPIISDVYSLGILMLELQNGMILHERHLQHNASKELILLLLNSNKYARIKYSKIIYFTENQKNWNAICQNSSQLLPYQKINMKSISEENGILIALQFARMCRKLQYFQQAWNMLEILEYQYLIKKENIQDMLKITLILKQQLGNYYRDIDEPQQGVKQYQECISILNKNDIGQPNHIDEAKLYIKSADIQEGGGCLSWYNIALLIVRQTLGTGNSDMMSLLINIGQTYEQKRDYKYAQLFYEELFIVLKNTSGFNGLIGIKLLDKLGTLYFYFSDYQKSLEKFKFSLQIKQILFFKEAFTIAQSFNSIGECYRLLGNSFIALQWYEKALSLIWMNRKEKEYVLFIAIIYNNMGICFKDRGKYKIALKMYEESYRLKCELEREQSSKNSTQSLETLLNIGVLHNILGYNTKGMQLFDEICANLKDMQLESLPLYSESIQNKALSFYNLRQYDKCLTYLMQALEQKQELYGKRHVAIGITQNNIALTHGKMGDYQQAVAFFEEALHTLKHFYVTHKIFLTIGDNLKHYKSFINDKLEAQESQA